MIFLWRDFRVDLVVDDRYRPFHHQRYQTTARRIDRVYLHTPPDFYHTAISDNFIRQIEQVALFPREDV